MKEIIHLLFCLAVCASCSGPEEASVPVLAPLTETRQIKELTPYVESVTFVPLEETDGDILIYLTKVLPTPDGGFIVRDVRGKIVKYDAGGKFVCAIGRKGHGNGEYLSVRDIALSEDGKSVLVLHLGGVSVYETATGKFLHKTEIPQQNYDAICPADGGGFYLFASAPTQQPDDSEAEFLTLYRFTADGGEPVAAQIARKDYILNTAFFSQSYDRSTYLRPLEGEHILYKITGDQVAPLYRIDYDNLTVPKGFIYQDGKLDFKNYIQSPYYKMTLYVHDTKQQLYFAAMGPEGNTHHFLLPLDGKVDGIHWEDTIIDPMPAQVVASDEDCLYVMLADVASYMDKAAEEMNPLTRHLIGALKESGISANDNPMLVKIGFRLPE